MPQDDLSVISFSILGVGKITWEMPEHVREFFDALGEPAVQQEFRGRVTNNLKGFFCAFSACFCVHSSTPEMLNNINDALGMASTVNVGILKKSP